MEISNKVGKYILIGIGASIIIAFLYGQVIIAPKFEKKGRYTIGIFNKYFCLAFKIKFIKYTHNIMRLIIISDTDIYFFLIK